MSHYIQSKSLKSAVTGRKSAELGKPNPTYIILFSSTIVKKLRTFLRQLEHLDGLDLQIFFDPW